MPKGRSLQVLIFMVLSSRDRKFVSVEIVWLGQSPGHRRLRFSFQFNDVKDPTGFRQPHCLAPVVGGGGYLLAGLFGVNRSFRTFTPHPGSLRKTAQKPHRAARGATLVQSVAIRLRLGKISISGRKARGVFAPFRTAWNWPRPSGRRYLGVGPCPVNHRLGAERNSPAWRLALRRAATPLRRRV